MAAMKTLFGSLLVLLALGSVYAWSLFNLPFSQKFGNTVNAVAFTFGLLALFLACGSSVSGFLKLRIGIQNVVALSAACTGLGLLGAAFAPNVWVLYLTGGVLLGLGDGLGYMLVLTNCVKFFPKHKGVVSALCIGAYGLGSLIFKSIDSYLMENYSLEFALMTWGTICTVAVTFGSVLIYDAMKQASVVSAAVTKREYELSKALHTLPYWLLSLMFFVDCMVGLYTIGVASNLGTALLNLAPHEAATAVSVIAIANIIGRLLMGTLSDRLPRIRLITFDQVLSLIALFLLVFVPLTPFMFFGTLAIVAFSFGGTLTIYPSLISDFFGIKNLAKNYGLLYLGFGLGTLFGYVAAFIFGTYQHTFMMMGVLLVVAIIASLMVRLPAELQVARNIIKNSRTEEEAIAAAEAALHKAITSLDGELVAKAIAEQKAQSRAAASPATKTATSTPAVSAATAPNANADTAPNATAPNDAAAPAAASEAAAPAQDAVKN